MCVCANCWIKPIHSALLNPCFDFFCACFSFIPSNNCDDDDFFLFLSSLLHFLFLVATAWIQTVLTMYGFVRYQTVYTNLNGIHFPWSSIECIFIIECVFEYGQMEIRGWVLISIAGALKHTVHLPYTLCFAIQELMKWIGRQIWDYECHTH